MGWVRVRVRVSEVTAEEARAAVLPAEALRRRGRHLGRLPLRVRVRVRVRVTTRILTLTVSPTLTLNLTLNLTLARTLALARSPAAPVVPPTYGQGGSRTRPPTGPRPGQG